MHKPFFVLKILQQSFAINPSVVRGTDGGISVAELKQCEVLDSNDTCPALTKEQYYNYLLGKGGYFLVAFVFLFVCLFVCLSVCGQHYSNSYEQIGMKF